MKISIDPRIVILLNFYHILKQIQDEKSICLTSVHYEIVDALKTMGATVECHEGFVKIS